VNATMMETPHGGSESDNVSGTSTPVSDTPPNNTPNSNPSTMDDPQPPQPQPLPLKRAARVATFRYYQPAPETPVTSMTKSMRYLRGLGHATTGSDDADDEEEDPSEINMNRLAWSASENKADNHATTTAQRPPEASTPSSPEKPPPVDKTPPTAKVQNILQVLSTAALAYQHLCNYRCPEAIKTLEMLSDKQQETGWVLHQKGKAHMEMNDFTSARRCLETMQAVDPGRVQGLELLSTVYWQLKKEMELANLAHTVVQQARNTPEAWCVVGNCFSLQKDHETALVFFQRSLQLDPDFAYTHTLSGYEYMANEDFDKAIKCFREAMRVDEGRYNAWYGLGAIYYRQEKYDLAVHHFKKAVDLHPESSVLLCNLGMAQWSNRQMYLALDTLGLAIQVDPRNPQARFQRANIYTAMGRLEDAVKELEQVRDAAPREATVYFTMGKVLKRLKRPQEAMKCFLTAMDLDPKDSQLIKSAMDKLDEAELDEEDLPVF
jgi:anaphase-promoting complex subunit 3